MVACSALAGCNRIFGLDATRPADAQFYDRTPDAPFACPIPGSGKAPMFSDLFVQIVPQGTCENYTTSLPAANLAVATCLITTEATAFEVDSAAIDSTMLKRVTIDAGVLDPKLSPEGDELWVGRQDAAGNGLLSVYTQSTPGTWQLSYDAYQVANLLVVASTPMQKGTPRRVLFSASDVVHELAEGPPGVWTDTGMKYDAGSFGVAGISSVPQLSPDGLRVVFAGMTGGVDFHSAVFYADRTDLSKPFGAAIPVVGPPSGGGYPFMTSDCGRLYFSGLGSIFYVTEQ